MARGDIERQIAKLEASIPLDSNYSTNLLALAEFAVAKRKTLRGAELALCAIGKATGDPATLARGHRLLTTLLPGYHIPMMNDVRRNAAWDAALRAAIRPGMHVLEIGTGAGMLALMAARAGAAKVTTCEKNPVVAAMAREIAARNGYADRIDVIAKSSLDLETGVDLDRRADLLVCDIFGDKLFDFDPLSALADARKRLLAEGAPVVPARATLRVALAHWTDYRRASHIDTACGFDLAPFAVFAARALAIDVGSPHIHLMSPPGDIFQFELSAMSHPQMGRGEVRCEAASAGEVNGIARWIRLDLDDRTALEACPEPGAAFFSRVNFCPLPKPVQLGLADALHIGSAYRRTSVETWLQT